MKFGLWIEPEMVNADSDLFRTHPDWILQIPGRTPCHGRYQYVLDFSRQEILDYIYEKIASILEGTSISYIKWGPSSVGCTVKYIPDILNCTVIPS